MFCKVMLCNVLCSADMYVCMHACMAVCMYVCTRVCMYVCMYVCMCVCVCMRVCVCIYIYMYVCMRGIHNCIHVDPLQNITLHNTRALCNICNVHNVSKSSNCRDECQELSTNRSSLQKHPKSSQLLTSTNSV